MNAAELRELILSKTALRTKEVPCPEWGVTVRIREMTGRERDEWEQSLTAGRGKVNIQNIRARLVAATAIDENGARVFTSADAEALGELSAAALTRCAGVAQKLNGLTEADMEEAKGNSTGDPSAASSSDSQATSGA
jgi:hypothetical protein